MRCVSGNGHSTFPRFSRSFPVSASRIPVHARIRAKKGAVVHSQGGGTPRLRELRAGLFQMGNYGRWGVEVSSRG